MSDTRVQPYPEDDPGFQSLLALVTENWALLGADEDPAAVIWSGIRAAYGRGYIEALETGARR